MKEATTFWLENLIAYNGMLISAPSVSAEHGAEIANNQLLAKGNSSPPAVYNIPGDFQDIAIIDDLFANTVAGARELDTDPDFIAQVKAARARLMPLKIGQYGQLQEWCEDIDNPQCNHRHISHLYTVWPGSQVSPYRDPALAVAAEKALNMRGEAMCIPCTPDKDEYTGGNWSRAIRIWCWVRLLDSERANKIFTELITQDGFENLLTFQQTPRDSSSPKPEDQEVGENVNMIWQVDASMAIPGFMAEMLLQFYDDVLYLLPALPTEWESGNVKGLRAPGDLTVEMEWKDGKLLRYYITSNSYKEIKVCANGHIQTIRINA
jgi:alpha-L-fucosidase 2